MQATISSDIHATFPGHPHHHCSTRAWMGVGEIIHGGWGAALIAGWLGWLVSCAGPPCSPSTHHPSFRPSLTSKIQVKKIALVLLLVQGWEYTFFFCCCRLHPPLKIRLRFLFVFISFVLRWLHHPFWMKIMYLFVLFYFSLGLANPFFSDEPFFSYQDI